MREKKLAEVFERARTPPMPAYQAAEIDGEPQFELFQLMLKM
ncbi:MAG: hypothetical protein R3C02_18860 [Planctomycetaceae bacterium]